MRTLGDNSSDHAPRPGGSRAPAGRLPDGRDARALLAGAAAGTAGAGAVLVLADVPSPLRAPFALFFLIGAPAAAVAVLLRRLGTPSRWVVASAAAVAVNLLIAQVMLALHVWSVRGGAAAVGSFSLLVLLSALVRHRSGRTARVRTP